MAILLFVIFLFCACSPLPRKELTLHYDSPAVYFEEALPLGNGSMGAMMYGDPLHERLSLNDITLWSGEPDKGPLLPDLVATGLDGDGTGTLQAIREALEQEDYRRADELQLRLQGHYSETYMPLGTLRLDYDSCAVSAYSRSLDIASAQATVSYERDGAVFSESCFVSAPDSVMVLQLRSEAPFSVRISLESLLPHNIISSPDGLAMDG